MRAHAHSTRAYTHAHSTRAYTHSHTHARALTMGSHLGMRISALDCTVLVWRVSGRAYTQELKDAENDRLHVWITGPPRP
jgi:hypothetical protein